jgi:hypothetical protein
MCPSSLLTMEPLATSLCAVYANAPKGCRSTSLSQFPILQTASVVANATFCQRGTTLLNNKLMIESEFNIQP